MRSLLLSLLLPALAISTAAQSAAGGVLLNEVRRDQDGADDDEYFELAGAAGTDLSPYTYLVLGDGSAAEGSGVIEAVVDLTGQAIPASGFFVAAEETFTLGEADLVTDLNFENEESVTHLLVTGFSGADGDDLDADDDGVLDVTPWTEVADAIGLADDQDDLAYGAFLGFVDLSTGASSPPMHVFRDGQMGSWNVGPDDVTEGLDTPGAENPSIVAVEDGLPAAALPLEAPYPNPARRGATVAFTLAVPAEVRLAVYDGLGRRVARLADGARAAGRHTAPLHTASWAPGVYVVRLETADQSMARRLTVVR